MRTASILVVAIRHEHDVVAARQRAKQIASLLGFDPQDQTRVATAVSELARNAFAYASGGKVEFLLEEGAPTQTLQVRITDSGSGIPDLPRILEGSYTSSAGTGVGIIGAKRLVDAFHIASEPGRGTTVTIGKRRPAARLPVTPAQLDALTSDLVGQRPRTPMEEMQQQNRELLHALAALERSQEELLRLNRELEDTNRGVVALYAELDEKAKDLHRADKVKSRFLTHMSHEFRTPLNSVLALARLLLDEADGELNEEQSKQVLFIRRAAGELLDMVNDLLDLAKVEAGTMALHPVELRVTELLSALRGMFLPLFTPGDVSLVIEEADSLPVLVADEGKVTQILRNFVSNALKFTQRGEVRVAASLVPEGDAVLFRVSDTGVGIAEEDLERIFEEFAQASGSPQHKSVGSGLGLAISKKLAELLGGAVAVESVLGEGSSFTLRIPVAGARPADAPDAPAGGGTAGGEVLIIDDNEIDRYVLRGLLSDADLEVVEAPNGAEGLRRAKGRRPAVIFLDLAMPGLSGFDVLERLREDDATRDVPVVVITGKILDPDERRRLDAAGAALLPKSSYSRDDAAHVVRTALRDALRSEGAPRA